MTQTSGKKVATKQDQDKDKDDEPPRPMVPWRRRLRLSDRIDCMLMSVGFVAAAAQGPIMPVINIVFGAMVDGAGSPTNQGELVNKQVKFMVYVAIVSAICSFVSFSTFMVSASRQVTRVREAYLAAVLRQDMAFFDSATGVKLVPRNAPSAPPAMWVPKKPAATHAGALVAAPPADAAANSSSPQLRHTDHEAAAAVAAGDENDNASSVGTFRTVAGDSAGVSDVGDDDASAADASAAVAADDISPPLQYRTGRYLKT